ncbi:TIGR01212 family radical SAM protein [candidate division KSB1 bacterium]|nr:TIGR01212 family radical SAM protein [candidate division KSB1 bacterium]
MDQYYTKFSTFLKDTFHSKVWKISLDAGLSCPNRDPDTGKGGCIFCRMDSFSQMQSLHGQDIDEQIRQGRETAFQRFGIEKYIVYFQSSTNTFAPLKTLRDLFFRAIRHPGVVGISIATRPDCLSPKILDLLDELCRETMVWVELGLQTMHQETLSYLGRGHSFNDYQTAMSLLKSLPLRICTHLMIGLPGETAEHETETARTVADLGTDEVKIHPLLILKDTRVEQLYHTGEITSLSLKHYAQRAVNMLTVLPGSIVIQRLTAEAPEEMLIEPTWALNKLNVLNAIHKEFAVRKTKQGAFYSAAS